MGAYPAWADAPGIGARMINARSETIAEKSSFKNIFKQRRYLILTDGFYEWRKENGSKQPHYIRPKSGRPFAFAGMWKSWGRNGEGIKSCTILTTGANDFL